MQNVKLQQKTLYSDKFLLHTNNSNADHYAISATEMVQMILHTRWKQNHRCRKQTYIYQGGKQGKDKLEDQD